MAACKSLRHIFDTTIPENKSPSLIESLSSLNHIRSYKSPLDHHHSFTEIFGELHFKENHNNSTPSSIFPPLSPPSATISSAFPIEPVSQSCNNDNQQEEKSGGKVTLFSTSNDGYSLPYHKKSASFTSLNSDSLQFCTEGLGSESLDDAEDLKIEVQKKGSGIGEKVHVRRQSCDSFLKKKITDGKTMFPPPIPYIGKTGKPSVSFQSFRNEGRFVLKEVRIPTQECLRAKREDGRLRLSFVQPDDDDDDDDDDDVDVEDYGVVEEEGESDDDGSVVENDDSGKEGEMGGVRKMEEEERGDGDKEEYGDKDEFESSWKE